MGNTFHDDGRYPIRRHVLTWKQTDPESEQIRFIERWQEGRVTFVELCRQFSVSRKTGYKRARRYEAYGWEGLGDWSRAPRHHPNRTPREVAERLIAAKQAHPTWGPKKLVAWLSAEPESPLPSPSTAGDILDRTGLVRVGSVAGTQHPGASPLPLPMGPTTSGPLTSRGGFGREMASGSTRLPCRMPHRGICLPVED